MALIELRQLSKAYGAVSALQNLELSIPEGCLYGLLGPNGAGKTTALRILSTLLAPDSGSVHVADVNALADPRTVRRMMGYVAQEVAIDKILSGRELLELQGDLYHLNRLDRDARVVVRGALSHRPWVGLADLSQGTRLTDFFSGTCR